MADWYVSSAVYATIAAFQVSHAYIVGDIIKPIAPGVTQNLVLRCTTAGTSAASEPTWSGVNNATTTSGGAVFTNISGQSAFGWGAAAGSLSTMIVRTAVGDRVFISSDHSETLNTAVFSFNNSTHAFGLIQIISVNRAGSVPPVAADIQNGAFLANTSGNLQVDAYCNLFWQGVTFSSAVGFNFNTIATKENYLKNCVLVFNNASSTAKLQCLTAPSKLILDNTTVQFGHVSQVITATGPFEVLWINTSSALAGSIFPTTLFNNASSALLVTCRGVDLSAITGTLVNSAAVSANTKVLLDSCRIAPGVTRFVLASTTTSPSHDEIELVNCFDGTNAINERHTAAGDLTQDTSTYMSSGAQDDVGNFSHKLVSSARSDICTMPLDSFWLDVENTATGSSKTATVEIISPSSLNNNDIKLLLEYMDTSGSSVADFVESLSSVLAASSALTSSSATWTAAATYTTLNPADKDTHITLSGGNLTATGTAGWTGFARALDAKSTGKFYWETTFNATQSQSGVGVAIGSLVATTTFSGTVAPGHCGLVQSFGAVWVNGATSITLGGTPASTLSFGTITSGTIICVAIDIGAKLIWWRLGAGGNWNNNASRDPAAGTGGVSIPNVGTTYPTSCFGGADTLISNFGASAFTGAVPSGFTAGWPNTPTTKQKLQVTFTPQVVGRVRGQIKLGKPSATLWVNPQIAIT